MQEVSSLCARHDSCGCLERTFSRLWTHCDDHGRCLDNARLIKAAIYPLADEIDVAALDLELSLLSDARLIYRYVADGKRLLQVRSWGEFQHPNRPKDSKWPAPKTFQLTDHCGVSDGSVSGHGADTVGVGEGGIVRALAVPVHDALEEMRAKVRA